MINLSLKDSNQSNLVNGTAVQISDGHLIITTGTFEKQIRLSKVTISSANYWIDSVGKNILVECFLNGEFIAMYSVSLGIDFDNLFPNAVSNWGAYFFKLHYQF
jgi:hypothetical protein